MGARRGIIVNCELIVTDDTTDPYSSRGFDDFTLRWSNAGRRAGSGATTAAAEPPRAVVRLTSGPDHFDPARGVNPAQVRADFSEGFPVGLLILGRGGDDILVGSYGSDHIEGEDGNDALRGAAGDDRLFGRTGADILLGDDGDDTLEGGRGRDRIDGGAGGDRLTGGFDADTLRGGGGRDRIVSVDGAADRVDCGAGRDSAIVDRRDRVRNCERVDRGS